MTLLIIYFSIAIGISFLCSVLEAVLLSITPGYNQKVLLSSPRVGKKIASVRQNLDQSLSSILILNTFAHTMGAAGVGAQAILIFGQQWETAIAIALTLAILYFSEIIPKTLGATFWPQLAGPASYIISWLVKLVYPLVWLSTRLTKLFSKNQGNEITREEIIALASLGHKDGNWFTQENEYLSNLLNLREVKTEQILTPRSVVHMLPTSMTVAQALDEKSTQQFTRIPVYQDAKDNVVGKVLRADLYEAERSGSGGELLSQHIKPVITVSEKMSVHSLLDYFIKKRKHLFMVTDEFGQMSGVVTLEDAIETLLGREIIDETDEVADMQALARSNYRQKLRADKTNKNDC